MKKLRYTILEMLSMIIVLAGLSTINLTAGIGFEAEGEITAKTDNSITIEGKEYKVNLVTKIYSSTGVLIDLENLSAGQNVKVAGEVVAFVNVTTMISVLDVTRTSVEQEGALTAFTIFNGTGELTVNGTDFTFNSETGIYLEGVGMVDFSYLQNGFELEVRGYVSGDENIATYILIKRDEIEVKGTITALSETSLTVEDKSFTINSNTKFVAEGIGSVDISYLELGQEVELHGFVSGDVSIATLIKVENEDDDGDDDSTRQELEVKGEITALTATSLAVASTSFTINGETKITLEGTGIVDITALELGQTVEVTGYTSADENIATLIKIEKEDDDGEEQDLEVKGEITALTETSLTVASTTFTVNNETKVLIEGGGYVDLNYLEIGQQVEVKGYVSGDENIAASIKVESEVSDSSENVLVQKGEITALTDNSITVNSTSFTITSETLVFLKGIANKSDLKVGQTVEVKGYTLLGENFAMLIKIEMEDNKGVDISTEGVISSLGEGMLSVNDMTFTLNSQTLVVLEENGKVDLSYLEVGQTVEVKAYVSGGENIAKIIKIKHENSYTFIVRGEITEMDSASLTVNDTKFVVDAETEFYGENNVVLTFGDFEVGTYVKVKANFDDGMNFALKVYNWEQIGMQQKEQEVNFVEEGTLVVGSQIYNVNSKSDVYASDGSMMSYFELKVGFEAKVTENIEDGVLYASKIELINSVSLVGHDGANGNINMFNYPNPFEEHSTLKFHLDANVNAGLDIYNGLGTKVLHVFEGMLESGDHNFEINLNGNFADGVYYTRLVVNGHVYTNMMIKNK